MEVPPDLYNRVSRAIQSALREEKQPLSRRIARIVFLASVLTAGLYALTWLCLSRHVDAAWACAFSFWWLILAAAFGLYFRPQPRLTIRGDFSPWVVGKVLITMTIATVLELIICPSFVVGHDAPPGSPFHVISDLFMSWGGMKGCMLLCGMTFVGAATGASFLLVHKNLSGSSFAKFAKVAAFAYLTQVPILAIQFLNETLRSDAPYWVAGSLVGLVVAGWASRQLAKSGARDH